MFFIGRQKIKVRNRGKENAVIPPLSPQSDAGGGIPPHSKNHKNKDIMAVKPWGYTFVELFIVIIIIGILTVVAIPQFKKASSSLQLESFTKNIYYLARYLQGVAIVERKVYCLNIDLDKGQLWPTYNQGDQFEALKGRFAKVYKIPEGVSVSTDLLDKDGIYFYPDGSIDEVTFSFEDTRYKRKISLSIKGAAGVIKIQ